MEDLSCQGASSASNVPQTREDACGDEGVRAGACVAAGGAEEARDGAPLAPSSSNGATTPSEDLLYSWLRFNLAIRTERVLKGFPFREVLVYSCLHRLRREEHRRVMEVVDTIAGRYGVDRLGEVIRMFDELSVIAEEVIR